MHRPLVDDGKQQTETVLLFFLCLPYATSVMVAGIHAVNVDRLRPLRGRKAGVFQKNLVMAAILMEEEYWMNTQFSIVKHYGEIKIKIGSETIHYIIVNKEGKDIFECSAEAKKAGRDKAIEPGEPADLVDRRYVPAYRMMGREAFIKMIKRHHHLTPEIAMELADSYMKPKSK